MTFDFGTAKCPFCKGQLIKSAINARDAEFYCGQDKCVAEGEEWSKYIILTSGDDWTQKITIGRYYVVNSSLEETTQLYDLEGCILLNSTAVPKMKIDPCLGEERIYEVLKTFLIFS